MPPALPRRSLPELPAPDSLLPRLPVRPPQPAVSRRRSEDRTPALPGLPGAWLPTAREPAVPVPVRQRLPGCEAQPERFPDPAGALLPERFPGPAGVPLPERFPGPAGAPLPERFPGSAGAPLPERFPGPADASLPERLPGPADAFLPERLPGPAGASLPERLPGPADASLPERLPGPADASLPERLPGPAGASLPERLPGPAGASLPERLPGPADASPTERLPGPADAFRRGVPGSDRVSLPSLSPHSAVCIPRSAFSSAPLPLLPHSGEPPRSVRFRPRSAPPAPGSSQLPLQTMRSPARKPSSQLPLQTVRPPARRQPSQPPLQAMRLPGRLPSRPHPPPGTQSDFPRQVLLPAPASGRASPLSPARAPPSQRWPRRR